MSLFRKRREAVQRLDEVECFLDEARERVDAQEPRINALTTWLQERRRVNGLGSDFEWTLVTPRGRM